MLDLVRLAQIVVQDLIAFKAQVHEREQLFMNELRLAQTETRSCITSVAQEVVRLSTVIKEEQAQELKRLQDRMDVERAFVAQLAQLAQLAKRVEALEMAIPGSTELPI